jgi:hypothetical protein
MLEEMGHPQPPTPIKMENSTSYFIGLKTGLYKDNAEFIENQQAKIWQITSPSITPQRIKEACIANMYTTNMLP